MIVERAIDFIAANEALEVTEKAQQLSREKADAARSIVLLQSAVQHRDGGEVEEGLDKLREATALSPQLVEAHFQLGLALAHSGQNTPEPRRPCAAFSICDLDTPELTISKACTCCKRGGRRKRSLNCGPPFGLSRVWSMRTASSGACCLEWVSGR